MGRRGEHLADGLNEPFEVEFHILDEHLTGFDLGQIQDVVDDFK